MRVAERELAVACGDLARIFNEAGVLELPDVRIAQRLAFLYKETDERVELALALTVRALRAGSVCIDPARIEELEFESADEDFDPNQLPWPDPLELRQALERSPLVTLGPLGRGTRPLRLVEGLLYLERYWAEQESLRSDLIARRERQAPEVDDARLQASLAELFKGDQLGPGEEDLQRLAGRSAARSWLTVVVGGPGTGKTSTVARILALLQEQGVRPDRIALSAPTGKAAARLEQSVREQLAGLGRRNGLEDIRATTLHRLLEWVPPGRFKRDRDNPLPHEAIVVDEVSMVSLQLASRLLAAARPDARLVLVGDPDQLASVEAGAVLADITRATQSADEADLPGVVRLRHTFRFGEEIAAIANAVRDGDADRALANLLPQTQLENPRLIELESATGTEAELSMLHHDVVSAGLDLMAAASSGDAAGALAALDRHRLLCAHRTGPYGVARWSRILEGWLAAAIPEYGKDGEWYVGRPLLVTRNLPELGVFNGDTGVIVETPRGPRAAFSRGGEPMLLNPAQLEGVQTVHAMTVHKSQGSQFKVVSVLLPPVGSPLLTRELLYTALTRASDTVRLIGTQEAVRLAIGRTALRASGLSLPRTPAID